MANNSHSHTGSTISGLTGADISGLGIVDFSSPNISQWTNDAGYVTSASVGDITGVTAGYGLVGGGSSGNVTLNVAGGKGINASADEVEVADNGITADELNVSGDGVSGEILSSDGDGSFSWTSGANQTITLSGDVSGSGTSSITTTVANNSHYHTSSTISGLTGADISGLGIVDFSSPNISQWTNDAGYITSASSGDITSVTAGFGLFGGGSSGAVGLNIGGSSSINVTADAIEVADNGITANELNVSGNGISGEVLSSDGDGSFSWSTAGGVSGSGTDGMVPQWSSSTGLTDTDISIDRYGNVGMGAFAAGAKLSISGSVTATSTMTATDFIGSSDSTLKKNIQDYPSLKIDSHYKSFEFKADTSHRKRVGVIAQELQINHPHFVVMQGDSTLAVSYQDLHSAEIAYLKKENEDLKKRIENLEKLLLK